MARGAARLGVALLVVLTAACSSGPPTAAPSTIPRFEPAPPPLQELVGTTFTGDLPPRLGELRADARSAGAAILNSATARADTDRLAMHWLVTDDRGDFVLTAGAPPTGDGTPRWRVRSAWRLTVAAGMVVTFGTTVCKPPAGSPPIDLGAGGFVVVTDRSQERALAAWTVTSDEPVPYPAVDELDCERFTP